MEEDGGYLPLIEGEPVVDKLMGQRVDQFVYRVPRGANPCVNVQEESGGILSPGIRYTGTMFDAITPEAVLWIEDPRPPLLQSCQLFVE